MSDVPVPEELENGSWSNGDPLTEPEESLVARPRSGVAVEYLGDKESAQKPENLGQRITIDELINFVPTEDADSVLGQRYLCKGGSCVVVGSTSAGKSSLGMQMAMMWALNGGFYGLRSTHGKPLKSLILQAENDVGDMAEMFQGIVAGVPLASIGDKPAFDATMDDFRENVIIVRDQTHTGLNFPEYARKLVEIHKPDLFWVDPMLSFYGGDISDQQEMTNFLRLGLNPISQETGIIWMMLHHTGKPGKDAQKSMKNWSARDFAYMGIGSSELSNWARAIITLANVSEDEFRVVFAKRGVRAGIKDEHGGSATELYLAHSENNICWKRIPKPPSSDETTDKCKAYANTVTEPQSPTQIVTGAAKYLKRGIRTCWGLWDSGNGTLGKFFSKRSDKLWVSAGLSGSVPYKDE